MKEEALTDALLREFLLGQLADEDRERIEDLFLTDPRTKERVLALEQDLIDDYLEDNLGPEEKERFVSRYAQTDEQRRQLRITVAIKDWAVSEANATDRVTSTVSSWSRIWKWLRLKPRFLVPIAVMIVIATVLAIVWLNSLAERRKHLAIEQELAQLNSSVNLREVPPDMSSFDLKPVSLRGIEPQAEIRRRAEIHLLELRLPWIQNERYSTYQAEVRRLGDREAFKIPNIQPDTDGRHTIRVRIRPEMLTRGDYQIKLIGVAADPTASSSEEYSFVVVN